MFKMSYSDGTGAVAPRPIAECHAMVYQLPSARPATRIAVTVMDLGSGRAPCPFFGKCDGILIVDPESGAPEFHENVSRTPTCLCDLILASGVDGLVCGFIGAPEVRRLREAGVDVRIGACGCSVDGLVECFCDLPPA